MHQCIALLLTCGGLLMVFVKAGDAAVWHTLVIGCSSAQPVVAWPAIQAYTDLTTPDFTCNSGQLCCLPERCMCCCCYTAARVGLTGYGKSWFVAL